MNIPFFDKLKFNNYISLDKQQMHRFQIAKKDSFELSFKGLRKNDFKGLDFMIVELFKAPIEKFANKDDYNRWAESKIDDIMACDYTARSSKATIQRKAILDDWYAYLLDENGAYFTDKPLQLLILSGITNDLKVNNDKIPPVLNSRALANAVTYMEEELSKNPKSKLNFLRIYNKKLQEIYISINNESHDKNGIWVAIPSYEHDRENFNSNVEKLKALSCTNWCTASTNAEPYLKKGDFHVYIVDGKPRVGIRFEADKIVEIQGQRNNSKIPLLYSQEIKDYTQKNNLKGLEDKINNAVETAKRCAPLKEEFKALLENKDYLAIFNHPEFDCGAQMLDNGNLKLKRLILPDLEFYGINPNELMDAVEIVDGDLKMDIPDILRFKNLREVNGNLDLSDSSIKSTGSIQEINGDLMLDSLKTEIGDNLQLVKGKIIDVNCPENYNSDLYAKVLLNKITKAKNKKEIFEILGIEAQELEDGTLKIGTYNPSELENFLLLKSYVSDPFEIMGISEEDFLDGVSFVDGDLNLAGTNIRIPKTIKKVKGDILLKGSKLLSLGSIEKVGGSVFAENSKLKSIGNLQFVRKDARFSNTAIKSTRYLRKVGGNLYLQNTNIEQVCFLKGENLGGKLYIDSYSFSSLDEMLYKLGLEEKTVIV